MSILSSCEASCANIRCGLLRGDARRFRGLAQILKGRGKRITRSNERDYREIGQNRTINLKVVPDIHDFMDWVIFLFLFND